MAGAAAERMGWEPAPRQGWVAPHLASEFPGLGIAWVEVDARPGRSPEPVRRRLRDLSDRTYGAQAIRLRERPIPWGYRVFYPQIGLDPDRTRTPVEQLTLDRLHHGGFRTHGLPADAVDIAILEAGVARRACDADRLSGQLGIRDAAPRARLCAGPAQGAAVPPRRGTGGGAPGWVRGAAERDADDRRRGAADRTPRRRHGEGLRNRARHQARRRCCRSGQRCPADCRRGGALDGRLDPGVRLTYNSLRCPLC